MNPSIVGNIISIDNYHDFMSNYEPHRYEKQITTHTLAERMRREKKNHQQLIELHELCVCVCCASQAVLSPKHDGFLVASPENMPNICAESLANAQIYIS